MTGAPGPSVPATAAEHAVTVGRLRVRLGDRAVLDGVDLEVPVRSVTAVVGPNGCGKSTLLRAVARLVPADDGDVLLDGRPVSGMRPRALARRLALLPQAPQAPAGLTVVDLVSRGRDPHRRWFDQWSAEDEAVVGEALERCGLTALAGRPLEQLSGGQRQRAWVALALAQRTPVLLLDEPTTYLDLAHQLEVLETVVAQQRALGTTTVMVLHDLGLAARYADHVVALRDGVVVAAGPAATTVTADLVRRVFDVEASVLVDPVGGRPVVVPHRVVQGAAGR